MLLDPAHWPTWGVSVCGVMMSSLGDVPVVQTSFTWSRSACVAPQQMPGGGFGSFKMSNIISEVTLWSLWEVCGL